MLWSKVEKAICEATEQNFSIESRHSLGGGSISDAYCIRGINKAFFVKTNSADRYEMFIAEFQGLQEIHKTKTIRVPQPICHQVASSHSFLVLEYISLQSLSPKSQPLMGEQLAKLHKNLSDNKHFGWHRDNTIGSTPQINTWKDNWIDFFTNCRLRFQFDLARKKGKSFKGEDELYDVISEFFQDYNPEPSLLHGDLWGGNASADDSDQPVIYDPATYYGDRETDLAFTELFGGFTSSFYKTYDKTYPIDPGYSKRKELYNLYHILNHYNLFGGSYASQAQSIISQCLK
ncbi:MAG: fructosamine kinase family protein [Bacteroidota bacterium]